MTGLRPVVVEQTRRGLRMAAQRWLGVRHAFQLAGREFSRAADPDDVYGGGYFGEDRDPLDRMGLSGYERYDRYMSNANAAAYMVWRHFGVHRTLDVGCAMGFVVEAQRELGIEAQGVDFSHYAVGRAAGGAVGHVRQGDLLKGLPVPAGSFDLVTVLETLEHLPPDRIGAALAELSRVTRRWVVATIPSFGPNAHGPDGWFQVKARDDRLAYYESLGPNYDGPLPYEDLYRDKEGEPIEGHLTIASFRWWTDRFAEAGLVRYGEMERRIHPDLARFGLSGYWNLYVLAVPGTPMPNEPVRRPEEASERVRLWNLDKAKESDQMTDDFANSE